MSALRHETWNKKLERKKKFFNFTFHSFSFKLRVNLISHSIPFFCMIFHFFLYILTLFLSINFSHFHWSNVWLITENRTHAHIQSIQFLWSTLMEYKIGLKLNISLVIVWSELKRIVNNFFFPFFHKSNGHSENPE